MATAWTALANVTLGASASSVTFSGISGSYRDLQLVITGNPNSNDYLAYRLNSDTASNYSGSSFVGAAAGGSPASYSYSGTYNAPNYNLPYDSAQRISALIEFLDYSATDKHKTSLSRVNYPNNGWVVAGVNRWASTSAITAMQIYQVNGAQFASGMSFALYGVSA